MYDVALRSLSGKEAIVPCCTPTIVGGGRVGLGGAVYWRRQLSSDSWLLVVADSMYFVSTWFRRSAALTVLTNADGERDLSVDAMDGVVDQTRLAWLSGRGRIAMGPPREGRKRW